MKEILDGVAKGAVVIAIGSDVKALGFSFTPDAVMDVEATQRRISEWLRAAGLGHVPFLCFRGLETVVGLCEVPPSWPVVGPVENKGSS